MKLISMWKSLKILIQFDLMMTIVLLQYTVEVWAPENEKKIVRREKKIAEEKKIKFKSLK